MINIIIIQLSTNSHAELNSKIAARVNGVEDKQIGAVVMSSP
jgi:hypothetical protein